MESLTKTISIFAWIVAIGGVLFFASFLVGIVVILADEIINYIKFRRVR